MRCLRRSVLVASVAAGLAAVAGCKLKPAAKKAPPPPAPTVESFRLADADAAVAARPAAVFDSAALKGFVEECKGLADDLKKLPIVPDDISIDAPEETVLEKVGIDPARVGRVEVSLNFEKEMLVAALESEVALDAQVVMKKIAELAGTEFVKVGSHAGVDLHSPEEEPEELAIAFVDEKLVVMGGGAGSAEAVKKGIDNLKAKRPVAYAGKLAAVLEGAPADAVLVVGLVTSEKMAEDLSFPAAGASEMAQKAESVLVSVTAGEAFDIAIRATMKDQADADEMRADAAAKVDEAREQVDEQVRQIDTQIEKLKAAGLPPDQIEQTLAALPDFRPVQALLAGVKLGGSGNVLEASGTLRPDVMETVKSLMPMLQMMLGGMGGPPMPGMGPPGPAPKMAPGGSMPR
jgi:hypothetical protein